MGGQGARRRPGGQPRHPHPGLTDDRLDELLRALAHPARRTLVRACLAEERAAGDLVALTGLAAPSVSEHLKVLRKTGLLVLEARGRFRLYRTEPAVLRELADAVGGLAGS